MKRGKAWRRAVALGMAAAVCLSFPAMAANKKPPKGGGAAGGVFVPPSPLDKPPVVLDAYRTDKPDMKVELTARPVLADPGPTGESGVPAGGKNGAAYGVAALRIHSLFQ